MAEGRLDPGGTAASARGEPADAVRAQILRAAQARFARYGFNKTTMAEIAADCAMSAANIYRYFDGKGDIAAVGTGRWLAALETELEGLADDAARAPAERL
ncbi:MAG TPA: helix-turn-helix domain-containing protein, partial [Alphaproteobacteria bacterium]